MGLTGGRLVKSVFSRSRSAASSHDNSHVNGRQERRRWRRSVRSYLCGDEFNSSVVAEEDSASIKSSEVVVTVLLQPPHDLSGLAGEEEEEEEGEKNSNSDFTLDEEDHAAAIVIQSAFRRFQARRQCRGVDDGEERRSVEEKDEEMVGLGLEGGISSPSRAESIGTSIEVQTANSVKAFSVVDETVAVGNHRAHQQQQQQQLRSRTQQLFKTKDEWDDSTVSSNISKMRVQHRLEAMTRRERALAYAFSQQLRICSKKRTVQLESEERGADMGWSWLERWMATRVPDNNNKYNKDTTTTTTQEQEQEQELLQQVESAGRLVLGKRLVDLAAAVAVEKESCGSNSVSLHLDSEDTENNNNTNNIPIPTNPLLRRKCVTKRQCQRVHAQISSKKVSTKEAVMDKRKKQKQQLQEINEKNQCPNDDTESDNSFTAASKLLG